MQVFCADVEAKRVFFAFSLTGWANDAYIVSWANCVLLMQSVFMLFLVKSIEVSAPVCSSQTTPFHVNCTNSVHLSGSSTTDPSLKDSRLDDFGMQTAFVLPSVAEYKHSVELQLKSKKLCSKLEVYVERLCFRSRLDGHWLTQQHICYANNGVLRLQTSGVQNNIKEPLHDHFIVIPHDVISGHTGATFHAERIGSGDEWPWFLSPMQNSKIHKRMLQSLSMAMPVFTMHCIITAVIYCKAVDIFTKSVQHTLSAEMGKHIQWYPSLVLCLVYIVTRELASVGR
eukprot:533216-Rhodomonas_salina.2